MAAAVLMLTACDSGEYTDTTSSDATPTPAVTDPVQSEAAAPSPYTTVTAPAETPVAIPVEAPVEAPVDN